MSRAAVDAHKPFTLVDTHNMTVTLFFAVRPPTALVVAGSEGGGMKRAIACSLDVASGALCRETVLRIPTRSVDCIPVQVKPCKIHSIGLISPNILIRRPVFW